jgi:hypothetical protein
MLQLTSLSHYIQGLQACERRDAPTTQTAQIHTQGNYMECVHSKTYNTVAINHRGAEERHTTQNASTRAAHSSKVGDAACRARADKANPSRSVSPGSVYKQFFPNQHVQSCHCSAADYDRAQSSSEDDKIVAITKIILNLETKWPLKFIGPSRS